MWRSIFLALGIFTLVLGLEALVVDSATFASHGDPAGIPLADDATAHRIRVVLGRDDL